MAYTINMDRGCGHKEEVELATGWHRREKEKAAFYASSCPVCGYAKGMTKIESAPTANAVPSPVETTTGLNRPHHYGTNKRSGRCRICGGIVVPGKGHLYYIDPDDAYEHSGWVVEHKDPSACKEYAETKTIYHV